MRWSNDVKLKLYSCTQLHGPTSKYSETCLAWLALEKKLDVGQIRPGGQITQFKKKNNP